MIHNSVFIRSQDISVCQKDCSKAFKTKLIALKIRVYHLAFLYEEVCWKTKTVTGH